MRSIRRAGEADPDGDGYVLRTVAANTLRIAGIGQLAAGGASFNGSAVLTFDPGRIRVDMAGSADVGFGSLAVAGEAWILHGEDRETDFVFAGRASGRLGDISGIDGAVFINTGAVDVTMDSGTVVQANTAFDVRLTAGLDLGLFKVDIGGRLFKQADLWELRIDRGTLDFFGVVSLGATGFYRSDRAFLINVNGSLTLLNGLPISGEGRITMSLGRDASGTITFRGEILGTSRYDFGWLGSGEGPSFRGNLAFGPSSVSFSMQLGPIFGSMWTFGPFVWQRSNPVGGERPDPVLARIQNGVLTLSAGDDPLRYGDPNGQWYGSILNESFTIEAVRDANGNPLPGRVRVVSRTVDPGFAQEFSGVTKIVFRGGDGNDIVEVGPGVQAVLDFDGGAGSDLFLVSQFAAGSRFHGGTGVGYDVVGVSGASADFLLSGANLETIAPAESPSGLSNLVAIDAVRFSDLTIGSAAPVGTRVHSGPVVNGDVHMVLRHYNNGRFVANLDLLLGLGLVTTTTDSRGGFSFSEDDLRMADSNGDGVTDWRDGMIVVGTRSDNGTGIVLSVIDSISGSDLGFPLVGLPGDNISLLSTLKYATLLRWYPGMSVGGIEATPALINALYASILKDVPATFFDDDFSEYLALGSGDPAQVALAAAHLKATHGHLINVLAVTELFRQFGLDFENEAAWGYQPDPLGADQLEIVAFTAYGYAIATRFGAPSLDLLGRPAVAPQFDLKNPEHVRALFAEILANYPTRRLFELEPGIVDDFVVDSARTADQQARIAAAIERHFGNFLDNLTDGIVHSQVDLDKQITNSILLSDLVPQLGQQLFVPSIAGPKRLFIEVLARELVKLAVLPDYEYRGEFYPLFFGAKLVDPLDRIASGWIGLSIESGGPATVTLSPSSHGRVRLRLDLFDELGALAAPDTGLAVRFRVGGTALASGDYTLSTGGVLHIAMFEPGSTSTTIDIEVSASALASGSRYLQIEILSADSGYRVADNAAVATIAFGAAGRAAAPTPTGGRGDFVPNTLVTRESGSDSPVGAPSGGIHTVLRGIDGEADLFVIGNSQAAGVPFLENINPDEGDGIVLLLGDVRAARHAAWLADPVRREAALAYLRSTLGAAVLNSLDPAVLSQLIDNRIDEADPVPAIRISEFIAYGGILFDVVARRPIAYLSLYSPTTGDNAWSSMSTSIAAMIFRFGDIGLSANSVSVNAAAGTLVGEIANSIPFDVGGTTYDLVSGEGDRDNALFHIMDGELRTTAKFPSETNPRLSIRVRATDITGFVYEKVFSLFVAGIDYTPAPAPPASPNANPIAPSGSKQGIRLPSGFTVTSGKMSALDFDVSPILSVDVQHGKKVKVKLRVELGSLFAKSRFGVKVLGTGKSLTFIGSISELNRFFANSAGKIRYLADSSEKGTVLLRATLVAKTKAGPIRSSTTSEITVR